MADGGLAEWCCDIKLVAQARGLGTMSPSILLNNQRFSDGRLREKVMTATGFKGEIVRIASQATYGYCDRPAPPALPAVPPATEIVPELLNVPDTDSTIVPPEPAPW